MRNPTLALVALLLPLGCSSENPSTPADASVTDTPVADVPAVDTPAADTPATDNPPPADVPSTACGSMRPDITTVRGTEGLVIGPDGTIYFSQARYIGRVQPDGTLQNRWISLPSTASTVWGLALDVANHRIFAGSPSSMSIFVADTSEATPTATTYLGMAGQPNGLTLGPDGALWYSDFGGGHVYRVEGAAMGTRAQVTTATISGANGLAFDTDGTLLVDSYNSGRLFRLHLTGNMETSRDTVASGLGSPDGLALDAMRRIYVTNQRASSLIRLDADGTNPVTLQMGLTSPANIEFGVGPLNCSDIYVATGGTLVRYEMGDAHGADVPWHRAR